MKLFRSGAILLAALAACPLWARVTWVVGEGTPLPVSEVAQGLEVMLAEPVTVVEVKASLLSAWVNQPSGEVERDQLLAADTLLISPSPKEPEGLSFLALRALAFQRRRALRSAPVVLLAQKPVYKMSGLCDEGALRRQARLALGAECQLVPFPVVWRQVYTDDTFYDGKVPKGAAAEGYVAAAAVTLGVRGEKAALPPLAGVQEAVAKRLADSIREGYSQLADVLYVAERMPVEAFPTRAGNRLDVILYDGAFERALAEWLMRIAAAEGRELVIHYTTDTTLNSTLPGLFRTTTPTPGLPNVACYTRPAFDDDTGLTELEHLPEILTRDAARKGWLPFPLAVAEWTRRLTGKSVYEGAKPTSAAAAMFAAMVYLDWTGSVALPRGVSPHETAAFSIGVEIMLASRLKQANPNAIFCTPLSPSRYAFSLWRRPGQKVKLSVAIVNHTDWVAAPRTLTFTDENFFAAKTVELVYEPDVFALPTGAVGKKPMLLWKVSTQDFQGQNSGAREVVLPAQP